MYKCYVCTLAQMLHFAGNGVSEPTYIVTVHACAGFHVTLRSGVLISARPRDVPHTEMKPPPLPPFQIPICPYRLTAPFEAFRTESACWLQGFFGLLLQKYD
jgi:hypothetical protein